MCKSNLALVLGIAAGFMVLTLVLSLWSNDAAMFAATSGGAVAVMPALLDGRRSGRCCLRCRSPAPDRA